MKLTNQLTDEALLGELGARLAQGRLDKNLTQSQLATQAGISKRTLERLEAGAVGTQLSAFIRVCRVLGLIEGLELLVPEKVPSPMARLNFGGRRRRRASNPRTNRSAVNEPPPATGEWTWGDNK